LLGECGGRRAGEEQPGAHADQSCGLLWLPALSPPSTPTLPLSASARSRDILGAARTGSGKTLAFVVPLLERLFRERWAAGDGLGALVISPTRELALQVRGR
jgi:hypothetical protein